MSKLTPLLEAAFENRRSREKESHAVRLFHGETEGDSRLHVECFREVDGKRAIIWVFEREQERRRTCMPPEKEELTRAVNAHFKASSFSHVVPSVYWLLRPLKKLPAEEPELVSGEPIDSLVTEELGTRFLIRTKNSRHPGLFLDHLPLRKWLMESGEVKGDVLNTFAYTGSLSLAAHRGGANSVLTLDLSRTTVEWAKENWKLNGFPEEKGDFIYGDTLDWIPRFEKKGRLFDAVILDPPSFSRGKNGTFSTERNLDELHRMAARVIRPNGFLISSINSETIPQEEFTDRLFRVLNGSRRKFKWVSDLEADPVGFPEATHLKGVILRLL